MMIKTMIPKSDSKSKLSLYEFTNLLPTAFLYELYKTMPHHSLLSQATFSSSFQSLPSFPPSQNLSHFPSLQKKNELFYILYFTSNCLPFPHHSESFHISHFFKSLPLANKNCLLLYVFPPLILFYLHICPSNCYYKCLSTSFLYPLLAPSDTSSSFLLSQSPRIQW